MALIDLTDQNVAPQPDFDNLVVRESILERDGGASLDMTGYPLDYLRGGHVVIRPDAGGDLKPMPLNGSNDGYGTLPADHSYYGHVVNTCSARYPFVGVMYGGKINNEIGKNPVAKAAGYFDLTPILTDINDALKNVVYEGDNY